MGAAGAAAGLFGFDVETDGTDEMKARPLGFSLSVEEGKACYIPLRAAGTACIPEEAVRQRLAGLLEDPSLRLVGQNLKYDYKVMRRWGVRMSNTLFDTAVAAWVLESDEGVYGLDRLAETRLAFRTKPYAELVGKDQTFDQVPLQQVTDYAAEDADLALRLYALLSRDLEREGLSGVLREIEMPLLTVLAEMELTGIRILSPELAAYSRDLESSLAGLEQEIYALCGRSFNINSTKQLQEILFTWRKLAPIRKTKTGFSTDVDVLEILAAQDPVPEKILAHRKLSKLKSTYVDALPLLVNEETGRLHTHYIQTGAATGRLASKDPNLQNIPIREEEGDASAPPSSRRPACVSSAPTTRRSSLPSWRTCRRTPSSWTRSPRARTCTARPPPSSSASARTWSRPSSAGWARPSTSASSTGCPLSGWRRVFESRAPMRTGSSRPTSRGSRAWTGS